MPAMSAIPFNRDASAVPGVVETLSPLVRRVVAPNPGPFTFTGTNTFIVGHGEVAVIDPGPPLKAHLEALTEALKGETVRHILVTHTHADHSPLARPLKERMGGQIGGAAPERVSAPVTGAAVEEENDIGFQPERRLGDADTITGAGWTLEALTTPGHTQNHLCYALKEENTLFTGDHVMGWSTSVVAPPDGDMAAYLESLEKVRARAFARLRPAHGGPVDAPDPFLAAYYEHRLAREAQILEALKRGPSTIQALVPDLYKGVDRALHGAAALSVHAHLIRLTALGATASEGPPTLTARYMLSR